MNVMQNRLTANLSVQAIFAQNDEMALGTMGVETADKQLRGQTVKKEIPVDLKLIIKE